MMISVLPNKRAQYSMLTNHALKNLCDQGISALTITDPKRAEFPRQNLRDAIIAFGNKTISADSYRHRVRMTVNHCRWYLAKQREAGPVKPAVVRFLDKCAASQNY